MPKIDGKPFTCRNGRFSTDLTQGWAHRLERSPEVEHEHGSVFEKPLFEHPDYSLWLEYVVDNQKKSGENFFWMMWYNQKGTPTITVSAVFGKDQLLEVARRLPDFIRLP